VDVLRFSSLNSSIGGLWHDIMASPTVISMVSDWRLPLLCQRCNPAPVVNFWNTFFQMLDIFPRELIGESYALCTIQMPRQLTLNGSKKGRVTDSTCFDCLISIGCIPLLAWTISFVDDSSRVAAPPFIRYRSSVPYTFFHEALLLLKCSVLHKYPRSSSHVGIFNTNPS
jgi:hypothetical protein